MTHFFDFINFLEFLINGKNIKAINIRWNMDDIESIENSKYREASVCVCVCAVVRVYVYVYVCVATWHLP